MQILIVGRNEAGKCDLTNKSDTEVWLLKVGEGGDVQTISTQRLPEVLRVLSRVGASTLSTPPEAPKHKS